MFNTEGARGGRLTAGYSTVVNWGGVVCIPMSLDLMPLGEKVLITTWFLPQRRFGDRIPVVARFSAPVQTGPGAHPASYKTGTVPFPEVKRCRGVTLTPHPF